MRDPHALAVAFGLAMTPSGLAAGSLPAFDHVVVVVEENETPLNILGSPDAPFLNALAGNGALFTNSFAIEHPSQPNYLDLFSGSNQGVTTNATPSELFETPNLGANLLAKGLTFAGFSESLPYAGFTGDSFSTDPLQGQYVRRHNPWANWQDSASNGLPMSVNLPFSDFPSDFSTLPAVSFIVPNLQNDMHDGSVAQGDAWLMNNLGAYAGWAETHNSLLIVTWDEDNVTPDNRVLTVFAGANVLPGVYDEQIDHFRVLRTIEDIFGLDHAGMSAEVAPISDVFAAPVPEPSIGGLLGAGLLSAWLAVRRDSQRRWSARAAAATSSTESS